MGLSIELKTPGALVLAASAMCGLVVLWQMTDGGLEFVRSELRRDSNLTSQIGTVQRVVALKARYMEGEREYWVFITGSKDSVQKRLLVRYNGGAPQAMEEKPK
jgi:hypothetical protein